MNSEVIAQKFTDYERSVSLLADKTKAMESLMAELVSATKFRAGGCSDVLLMHQLVTYASPFRYKGVPANKILFVPDSNDCVTGVRLHSARFGRSPENNLLENLYSYFSNTIVMPTFNTNDSTVYFSEGGKYGALKIDEFWFTEIYFDQVFSKNSASINVFVFTSEGNNKQPA